MNSKAIFKIVAVLIWSLMAYGCREEAPTGDTRQVKYEISGNFSGKLLVVYTSANGNSLTEDRLSGLPWSKQVTYETKVTGAGISVVSSDPAFLGSPGQTITLKIFAGNKVRHSEVYTANAMGIINIPTMAFVF